MATTTKTKKPAKKSARSRPTTRKAPAGASMKAALPALAALHARAEGLEDQDAQAKDDAAYEALMKGR